MYQATATLDCLTNQTFPPRYFETEARADLRQAIESAHRAGQRINGGIVIDGARFHLVLKEHSEFPKRTV